MTDLLKGIFNSPKSIKNVSLDTNSVDSRVIQDGAVNTIQLANGSVTLEKFAPTVKNLILPNTNVFYGLANASAPGANNPFVTRQDVLTYQTNWKDPVQTFDNLPTVDSGANNVNDIRLVTTEKQLYTWQNNAWVKISGPDTAQPVTSSGYRNNVGVFTYDFTLGQNSSYTLVHAPDKSMSRIVQIKERILGFDAQEAKIDFSNYLNYTKSSNYTVSNTLVNMSSNQILGDSTVVWEEGMVGLLGEDESGNQYRVSRISAQDSNALPFVIYLSNPLTTSYTGNFYFSNINVNNDEASLIRQKDADEFTILRDTSDLSESAKNVQVLGSKETGIVGVLSIREDNSLVFSFKADGDTSWNEYNVNYLFGTNSLNVQAYRFFAIHLVTKPQDVNVMTNPLNNLPGNDMYAVAYIEAGTKKPFYLVWSHNFGSPVFYTRFSLDTSTTNYEDVHMAAREATIATNLVFSYKYAVGITASVISPTDGSTSQIGLWLNEDAGPTLNNNWTTSSPILSAPLNAENPKIVLSPGYAPDTLLVSGRWVWDPRRFSIWITYRDQQNYSINTMLVKHEQWYPSFPYPNETFLFEMGRYGQVSLGWFSDPTNGYEQKTLFSDINFKCGSKYDFDVALWEDYDEPGLLYQDAVWSSPTDLSVHLRGTLVVVASNTMSTVPSELVLAYKQPSTAGNSIVNWSPTQQLNKFGNNLRLKVEPKQVRNFDHPIYEAGYSNADHVHIFYVNQEVGKASIPVHIHNKYGTWISESNSAEVYPSRMRNFSSEQEYLDYPGLTDYDFALDSLGQVDFAAFYGSADANTRGLYFSNQQFQCKYAIWSSNLGATLSGPGLRAGFTTFHYGGCVYIQGGYAPDGTVDSSMWRLDINNNIWELITANNPPERVFHVSDVVKNVAYKGSIDALAGITLYSVNLNLSRFQGVLTDTFNQGSSSQSNKAFFQWTDDKVDLNGNVLTTEGYLDSILGYEFYNLTSGSHGTVQSISDPVNGYVTLVLNGFVTQGSRTSFLNGDQIVISYPGKPAYDQVVMYGGGAYQSSRSNGFPDDTNSQVTWPPDTVEFTGDSNSGDSDVYRDARQVYIASLGDTQVNFTTVPIAVNGALSAPVPCISGQLVITDYTQDSVGGISSFPNFVILNRTNAFRFKLDYEQDQNQIGRPFTFLGHWSQLDPIKSSNGEPIEGLNSWKGAKIYHYGGIKPAPKGHSVNPYVESPSVVYFGGFTQNDFTGYYSNSLLIINALDVNLGWSLVESTSKMAPQARAGNGTMVVNRQIEKPNQPNQADIVNNLVQDTNSEVWVSCGNNGPLDVTTYDKAQSLNDTWLGRLIYQRRAVNGILAQPVTFTPGDKAYQAVVDVNLNSALGSFMVPNGLRTSNNLINSAGITVSNRFLNDRYMPLSINDTAVLDYYNYSGLNADNSVHVGYPNWISPVAVQFSGETTGDNRTVVSRGGTYFPTSVSPLGERRWTCISRLVITIPEGPGSGDHNVFVGVFNNGIKSVVEYFLPNDTQFAFNLAFLELSGGAYDPDPDSSDGKSWIDVGTGNLHLQINNILSQPLGDLAYPYVSSVDNTNFVELTGVNWADMTSEIGVGPMKNTWGGLVSDSFSPDTVAYFGGRTHNKILLKNTFKWNQPSVFVENETSDVYSLALIDGSIETNWISLKHGNLVKDAATAELGEIIDYNLSRRSDYSAWGVAKVVINSALNADPTPNDRTLVYYVGFNVIPFQVGMSGYAVPLMQGLGYIQFEPINYPAGITLTSSTTPLLEGQLNYQTGQISVNLAQTFRNAVTSAVITPVNILFQIVDINYHTYESPLTSYYDLQDFAGTVTRYIGDKVGGEYSSRIGSWIYTAGASIDAESISFIQDDRAVTSEFDTSNYSTSRKLDILDSSVASIGHTFTSALATWTQNLQSWLLTKTMILYIPAQNGYTERFYKISSVTDDHNLVVDITGPYGSLAIGSSLGATIFENKVFMTDVNTSAVMPNADPYISVPRWMNNEMRSMHLLYQDGHSVVVPNSNPWSMTSDLWNSSSPKIINNAEAGSAYLFGKLTFTKKKVSSSDPDIEYYQYFLQETSGAGIQIVGGNQILLKVNGVLQSYNAVTDSQSYNLPFVTSISSYPNMSTSSFDISYTFGVRNSTTGGSLANVGLETDILYYADSMSLPTEIINPSTYMQWQGTTIKVLFSFDEGLTWKKYDPTSDIWLAVNAKDISSNGMEFNDLFDIVSWQWSGWNNFFKAQERGLPGGYLGFVEGQTQTIKMLVGLDTEEPAKTAAISSFVMNLRVGNSWEPKNFFQDGNIYGSDSGYVQVKMTGPVSTVITNRHSTSTKIRQLKATVMVNQ